MLSVSHPVLPSSVAHGPRQLRWAETLLDGGILASATGPDRASQDSLIDRLRRAGVQLVLVPDLSESQEPVSVGHWYAPVHASDETLRWALDNGCPVARVEDSWRHTAAQWMRRLVAHAPGLEHALRRAVREVGP